MKGSADKAPSAEYARGLEAGLRRAAMLASVRAAKQRGEASHAAEHHNDTGEADMYDADAMGAEALAKLFYSEAEAVRALSTEGPPAKEGK